MASSRRGVLLSTPEGGDREGSRSPSTASGLAPPSPSLSSGRVPRLPAAGGLRHCRLRAKAAEPRREGSKERVAVTSELDLEIKRELVSQALVLAHPAPQNKASRLKKQWEPKERIDHVLPLDDAGNWVLSDPPSVAEAVRPDAPERCPALEPLDFRASAAPEVVEYAEAHLALYRCWSRGCGQGKESLGQLQLLKLLERGGLVGPGGLFQDRVAAQLWASRAWRDVAEGAYGLNLPKFVHLAGRIGRMLLDTEAEGSETQLQKAGVIEFVNRGLCNADAGRELPPIGPSGGACR